MAILILRGPGPEQIRFCFPWGVQTKKEADLMEHVSFQTSSLRGFAAIAFIYLLMQFVPWTASVRQRERMFSSWPRRVQDFVPYSNETNGVSHQLTPNPTSPAALPRSLRQRPFPTDRAPILYLNLPAASPPNYPLYRPASLLPLALLSGLIVTGLS